MSGEIKTVTMLEDGYPEMLRLIHDPPELLYYIGDLSLASEHCVAVVGSRKATEYGKTVARRIGSAIAAHGLVHVSGMASGIDTMGHKGAVESGGKSIAVLGCGVDVCYPKGNAALKELLENEGLIISEYPPGTQPMAALFPQRNRIISGISREVVIVEAGLKSGSLITAELAIDQGRSVFAVPGNITSVYSFGTNKLIADGAEILAVIDDLFASPAEEPRGGSGAESGRVKLSKDEQKIYNLIAVSGEMTLDAVCRGTGLEPGPVNGIITVLEMKGLVRTSMGRVFV